MSPFESEERERKITKKSLENKQKRRCKFDKRTARRSEEKEELEKKEERRPKQIGYENGNEG